MDLQYGCQTSNRYTGYLDSSDYGNPVVAQATKKRKLKKKRKSKQRKFVDKAVNTEGAFESENSCDEMPSASDAIHVELAVTVDTEAISGTNDEIIKNNDEMIETMASDAAVQLNTSTDSGKGTDATADLKTNVSEINSTTKWSDICFEEEKAMKDETEARIEDKERTSDLEVQTSEPRKGYPTVYVYNSKYQGLFRDNRLNNWSFEVVKEDGRPKTKRHEPQHKKNHKKQLKNSKFGKQFMAENSEADATRNV